MTGKLLGAGLIIVASGFVGFSMAAAQKREARLLQQLKQMLGYLEDQLRYQLPALPELLRAAAVKGEGELKAIFFQLSDVLDVHTFCCVEECMESVLGKHREFPDSVKMHLLTLGKGLGAFDLQGQLSCLKLVVENCNRELELLNYQQKERLRSFRTLGLCAGAGIAILLM